MPTFVLSNTITEDTLVDYTIFTVKNSDRVNNLQPIKNLEASDELINFIIRTEDYVPYAYLDVDGITKIGYNLSIETNGNGLTEQEAYTIFIDQLKIAERKLKQLLPIDTITQSQYDALLSLYFRTGDFKKVGTDIRKFNIYEFIKERKWNYVATALTNSGNNRTIRQTEAKILMLGDYGSMKRRHFIKAASLKKLERDYPAKMLTDQIKIQAERVYFVETQRFLPGMTQSRKRFISKQLT